MTTRTERLNFILTANTTKLVGGLKKGKAALKGLDKQAGVTAAKTTIAFKGLDRAVSGVATKVTRSLFSMRSAMVGLAAGAGAAAPIKFAADFQKALANVDTLLVDAAVGIDKYRKQLLQLSQASSKDLLDLTQGLYQTISAGIPVVEGAGGAFEVLATAQRAAVAGLATTEQAVDAFTTVLNAYADAGLTAADVSDKLFTTVRLGKTTFPELASGIGRVATVASKFNVSIDEVLGSLVQLTKVGLSTDEAVTQLRATILALAKPGKEAAALFKSLNIEIGEEAFAAKGLAGVLADVSAATGDSADRIAKMIPNVRAIVGALSLGTDGAKAFANATAQIRTSAGATDAAYKKIAKTFSDAAAIFKSQFVAALVVAGEKVLPRVQKVMEKLGTTVVENQEAIGDAFATFVETLFKIGEFIAEHGKAITEFFATSFVAAKIIAANAALVQFVASVKAFAAASAIAGAASGTAFATGFQKAVKFLPSVLKVLLRSPSLLAVVVGLGVLIGKTIIDAAAKGAEKAVEAAKRDLAKIIAQGEAAAKKLGFTGHEEARKGREAVSKGEKLVLGGTFGAGTVQTPSAALGGLLAQDVPLEEAAAQLRTAADASLDKMAKLSIAAEDRAAQLSEAVLERRRQLARIRDAASAEADTLRQQIGNDEAQLNALRDRQGKLAEAAARITDLTETAIEDVEFKAADKELKDDARKAADEAVEASKNQEKAAKRREAALKARIALLRSVAEAETALLEAEATDDEAEAARVVAETMRLHDLKMAQLRDEHALRIETLQASGADEAAISEATLAHRAKLAAADAEHAQEVLASLEAQAEIAADVTSARLDALDEIAEREIADAQAAGDILANEFARGSQERLDIEAATDARILQIREQLAFDSTEAERTGAESVLAIRVAAEQKVAAIRRAENEQAKVAAKQATTATEKTPLAGLADAIDGAVDGLLAGASAFGSLLASGASAAADIFHDAVTGPITDALTAPLGILLGGLDDAISTLFRPPEEGVDAAEAAGDAIDGAAVEALRVVDQLIASLPTLIEKFLGTVAETLPTLLVKAAEAAVGALGAVADNLGPVLQAAIEGIVGAVPLLIDGLVASLPKIFDAVLKAAISFFNELPALFDKVVSGVIDLIEGLLSTLADNIGPLVSSIITAVLGIVSTIAERLPELVETLIAGISEVVASLIDSMPEIIASLAASLPRLIPALIKLAPALIVAILKGVVLGVTKIVASWFGLLKEFFMFEWIDSLGEMLTGILSEWFGLLKEFFMFEWIDSLGEMLTGILSEFFEPLGKLSEFFEPLGKLVEDLGSAIGDTLGLGGPPPGVAGGRPGDTGGRTDIGIRLPSDPARAAARAEEIAGIARDRGDTEAEAFWLDIAERARRGERFHGGGRVRGGRDVLGAAVMRASGARGMAAGGIVQRATDALRQSLSVPFQDDVPTVLQEGEHVLSRAGVAAAGGHNQADRLNRGQPLVAQMPAAANLVIQGDDAGVRALLATAIRSWRVEAATAGSGVRTDLDAQDPFYGMQFVAGRT